MYFELAKQQDIDLTFLPLPNELYVNGDRDKLKQVFINVIDNAIKYNKSGGEVEIACEDTPSGARLTVSDTGIGIPKDVQDRVFERFYRVDKSHSSKMGGTGLGLSIVKHAALYHKAQISLSSELGTGTKITVSFPKI
jgi:two-component system phosphate regulon sensor histidine kinase PhoR